MRRSTADPSKLSVKAMKKVNESCDLINVNAMDADEAYGTPITNE